jgi:hypothetical protein
MYNLYSKNECVNKKKKEFSKFCYLTFLNIVLKGASIAPTSVVAWSPPSIMQSMELKITKVKKPPMLQRAYESPPVALNVYTGDVCTDTMPPVSYINSRCLFSHITRIYLPILNVS